MISAFELDAQNHLFTNLSEAKTKLLEAREAVLSVDTSQFTALIEEFSELEVYFYEEEDWVSYAQSFADKSELMMRRGDSREVINAAAITLEKIPNENLEAEAILYTAIGYAQEVEGLYESSLLSFSQAIKLLEDFPDSNYHKLNANLGRANILLEKWGLEGAKASFSDLLRKAKEVKKPSKFIQHLKGRLCFLIGDTYTYSYSGATVEGMKTSKKYFEEGLRFSALCSNSKDNLLAGLINNSMGYLFWVQYKKFDNEDDLLGKSETTYNTGIQQLVNYGGPKYPILGRARNNLAMTYQAFWDRDMKINTEKIKSNLDQSKLDAAKNDSIWTLAFQKSIKTYNKTLNEYNASLETKLKALNPKHPFVVRNYTNLGSFLMASRKYTEALELLDLAITSNLKSDTRLSGSNFENIIASPQMVHPLRYQIATLENRYNVELDPEKKIADQKECLETYELMIGLLEHMISGYFEKKTQINLLDSYEYSYENAINICLELFEQTKEVEYKEKALVFIEKSKANLSRLLIRENEALKYVVDIASYKKDSILRKEIDSLATLQREEERSVSPDIERINLLESQVNNRKDQHGKFIGQFEKDFPGFKNMKYKTANPSLENIQSNILSNYSDSTAILDYFMGKKNIVIATVTKNDLQIIQKPIAKEVDTLIKKLRNEMSTKDAVTNEYGKKYVSFKTKAYELYKHLLENVLSTQQEKEINNLVIIPSSNLSLFPMEILLTKTVDSEDINYEELPYLLRQYNISYAYSLSLLEKSFEQKNNNKEGQINYTGFACTDLGEDQRTKSNTDLLQRLNGAETEVLIGKEILGGNAFVDENATEEIFRNLNQSARILHLAMHTNIDTKDPNQSKFLFCGDDNDAAINDNNLHYHELYGLSNVLKNTELAILTACNTGNGPKINGEGIVSLSQAFTNTNCKSALMSLWLVNDVATPKLLEYFFKNISKGLSKSDALRQAKLSYLEDGNKVHPYYWASLVLSGNDSFIDLEIQKSVESKMPFYLVGLSVFLIGLGVLKRFFQKK